MISDKGTTLSELKNRIKKFIDDRDWGKYHNPKDIAVSITIEASELLELFQWVKDEELEKIINNPKKVAKIEEELADVTIYCFDLANACNIDIAQAVAKKIKQNEDKYPTEKVKGNYIKYSEL